MQGQQCSFTAALRYWTIEIGCKTCGIASQIQFCVKSKMLYNIEYKGALSGTDLALQKSVWKNKVEELYRFLEKENAKKLKIFDFLEEEKKLRIANRRDKNVICIELDRYVDSVKEVQRGKQDELIKSYRVSTEVLRFSKTHQFQGSKEQQQKGSWTNKTQRVQDVLKLEKPTIKQIKDQSQEQDIDYEQWLNNSHQNSDQQAQKRILQVSSQQSPTLINSMMNQATRFQFVISQQVNDQIPNFNCDNIQYSDLFPIKESQNIMMQSLLIENKKLKQERTQLLEHIAMLSRENNVLKSTIQRSAIKKSLLVQRQYERDCQYPEMRTTEVCVNNQQKMSMYKYEQKQQTYSGSHITSIGYSQDVTPSTPMRDEWVQEFQNTKRTSQQSFFYQFFNRSQGVFDISYKFTYLQSFKQNFFGYDWRAIRRLNLDGNHLGSQGFNLLVNCHFPQLKQISVGYNCISEVQNIQPLLENLQQIDLRANPLNEASRFYLKKLAGMKGIKLLI